MTNQIWSEWQQARSWLLIVALMVVMMSFPASTLTANGQHAKLKSDKNSAIPSAREKEAAQHYRVAKEALAHGDYDVALEELKEAAVLAPTNAVVWYNLAVVESKKGDAKAALNDLNKAQELRLPTDLEDSGNDLLAKLTYAVKKKNASDSIGWSVGSWATNDPVETKGSGCAQRTIGLGVRLSLNPDLTNSGELRGRFYLHVTYVAGSCIGHTLDLSCDIEQQVTAQRVDGSDDTVRLLFDPLKMEKKGSHCFGDWDHLLSGPGTWGLTKHNDASIDIFPVFSSGKGQVIQLTKE